MCNWASTHHVGALAVTVFFWWYYLTHLEKLQIKWRIISVVSIYKGKCYFKKVCFGTTAVDAIFAQIIRILHEIKLEGRYFYNIFWDLKKTTFLQSHILEYSYLYKWKSMMTWFHCAYQWYLGYTCSLSLYGTLFKICIEVKTTIPLKMKTQVQTTGPNADYTTRNLALQSGLCF